MTKQDIQQMIYDEKIVGGWNDCIVKLEVGNYPKKMGSNYLGTF